MSIDAMSWAFKQQLPPSEKLVLLSLADHHNAGTGKCIPGQASIAEQTCMSVRTVQRHLVALEERGLISRAARFRGEGRGRTSDAYILHGDNLSRWFQGDRTRTTNTTIQDVQGDTVVVPLTVREPEENILAAAPRERPRDELFEAVCSVAGHDPARLTRSERGAINGALKDLRQVDATPEQVAAAGGQWPKLFPQATLTVPALVKHWSRLLEASPRAKAARSCDLCGQLLDDHDAEFCVNIQEDRYGR